jgi:hypothetical protein
MASCSQRSSGRTLRPCGGRTDCASCLTSDGFNDCAWCGGTNVCIDTKFGPDDYGCPAGSTVGHRGALGLDDSTQLCALPCIPASEHSHGHCCSPPTPGGECGSSPNGGPCVVDYDCTNYPFILCRQHVCVDPNASSDGGVDASNADGAIDSDALAADAPLPPTCDPPCLADQSCQNGVCRGDACNHVACPAVTCTSSAGSASFGGCTNLPIYPYLAASCGKALNSLDPAAATCTASPSNSMKCVFPTGTIACPSFYIASGGGLGGPSYVEGCCSDEIAYPNGVTSPPHSTPFCGIPANVGCQPIDPGDPRYTPAP